MKISSKNTITNLSKKSWKMPSIRHMETPKALDRYHYELIMPISSSIFPRQGIIILHYDVVQRMKVNVSLSVPSFFLTNKNGAPHGDTLGHMYPFFKSLSSYICNSFSLRVFVFLWCFRQRCSSKYQIYREAYVSFR